jgi:nucleoside-diphosphate-sugar epimerase
MKIFVAGGTGVIGIPTVRALSAHGHDLTVARRADVDIFDRHAVAIAVAGHDAVVNLLTAIPPLAKASRKKAWAMNERLRRDASRNLVDAAQASTVTRFVQESICFPYVDGGDAWITEDSPREYNWATESSAAAERTALSFVGDGRDAVVLRFGALYSADSSYAEAFNRFARRHVNPFIGPARAWMSSIHADDAAAAVVAALTIPSGVYNVVDDEPLRRRDAGAVVAEAVGRTRLWTLPGASMMPRVAKDLMRSQRVSNAKLRATGEWAPTHPSIRGSWPSAVRPRPTAGAS